MTNLLKYEHNIYMRTPGVDQGFQVRGGGGGRAEGGVKIFGVFRVKNHDFTPKNHIFTNCGGRHEHFWGISCEKSRFYAKKSYFFPILGGGGAGCAPPPPPPWICPWTQTLCHRIENNINQQFVWMKVASIIISRSTVSDCAPLSRGAIFIWYWTKLKFL